MRKTLLTIALVGGAYYLLYKYWQSMKKKEATEAPSKVIEETIALAKEKPQANSIIRDNRRVFKSMRQPFNDDESATVAPSINAKIGIF
jgi:predicted negative regulator of RcsB-dependent stress response